MTIRKGEAWGTTGRLAPDAPVVDSNRALHDQINAHDPLPAQIGVIGGDLARTTGATAAEDDLRHSDGRPVLPIDLGVVRLDGVERRFATHVIVRRLGWLGWIRAVLNVPFVGEWNVAPRAHPNDGRLDYVDADLSLGDFVKARSRLRSGTHVPHPSISIRRVTETAIDVAPGQAVWVDGVRHRGVRRIECRVEPDAISIVI